uniref:Single-stranded DNA binding protein n=1 Tax=Dichotomaria marginata TaxID=268567 RepID=A0A1G4NSA0_9FLOR|nr:Hypothetical protein ycf41 [Dichotomaria marginata]SCW21537.1 Hypothetical protein ycf41 [Dichotomaria marginata]
MNIYFFTVQIATWPRKRISSKGQIYTSCFMKIPNPKKGRSCDYIYSVSTAETGENIIHLYNKGDYLIIEGQIQLSKKTKKLQLNIVKDHPLILN